MYRASSCRFRRSRRIRTPGHIGFRSRLKEMVSLHGRSATNPLRYHRAAFHSFGEKSHCCPRKISIKCLKGLRNGSQSLFHLPCNRLCETLTSIAAPVTDVRCPPQGGSQLPGEPQGSLWFFVRRFFAPPSQPPLPNTIRSPWLILHRVIITPTLPGQLARAPHSRRRSASSLCPAAAGSAAPAFALPPRRGPGNEWSAPWPRCGHRSRRPARRRRGRCRPPADTHENGRARVAGFEGGIEYVHGQFLQIIG